MVDSKVIGNRLRTLRGERTLQCTADAIGVSLSAMTMYELGERIPRDEIKVRIAKYYNVGVETIFFDEK